MGCYSTGLAVARTESWKLRLNAPRGLAGAHTNLEYCGMIRELLGEETYLAYLAMRELRPFVGTEEEFVDRVNRWQRPEGYRLVAAFTDGEVQAVAAAGFRTGHYLAWGHALYCDDLSSRPEFRRQGYAGMLIDWMIAEALRLGCEQFHLDSGVGPERQDAHRLYLTKRMCISAHHFALVLNDGPATPTRG